MELIKNDAENTYHVADYYITTTLMRLGDPNIFFSVSIKLKSDQNYKNGLDIFYVEK